MGPFTYHEPIVADTLQNWFATEEELFAELYRPHSGAGGDFYRLLAYADYQDLMDKAHPGAILSILRQKQLPIRGIVDDAFISRAIAEITEGDYYIVVGPGAYPDALDFLGSGNRHEELKDELENIRGTEVWVGPDFVMPNNYWESNTAQDALVVIKP